MILFAPDQRSILNIDQFRTYDKLFSKLLNNAHYHCADSETMANLSRVNATPFVTKDCTTCHHFQLGKARKAIHDALGYPIREVFHVRIITCVNKRKHRKRIDPFIMSLFLGLYPKAALDRIQPSVKRAVSNLERKSDYREPKPPGILRVTGVGDGKK